MRIVTWNCYRGDPVSRFERLAALRPNVAVLQECSKPKAPATDNLLWFGDNPRKGMALVSSAGYSLTPGPIDPTILDSTFPVDDWKSESDHRPLLVALKQPATIA